MSVETRATVLVDTNVLLAATDRDRACHRAALEFLRRERRDLAITPQIAREYLAVATRPVTANGLGLTGNDACGNLDQFLDGMRMLAEDGRTTTWLSRLVGAGSVAGKQVHDANLVAVALAHDVMVIVTDNTRHFARFASLVRIEALGQGEDSGP